MRGASVAVILLYVCGGYNLYYHEVGRRWNDWSRDNVPYIQDMGTQLPGSAAPAV